jgi:hypothetical protein
MITGDVFNVVIDAQTIALVDAWAAKSAFEPSRRQAVRALLRQALRAHELRAAKVSGTRADGGVGMPLTWRGNALCVGRSSTPLVSIEPDKTWPTMWRVRHGDQLSDILNKTRARDAARCLALSLLQEGGAQVSESLAAPPVEQNSEALITLPDAASDALHASDDEGRRTGLVVGQVERAKGGRGKRGGISDAARRAGISRYAAMRAAKRVRAAEGTRLAPDAPKPVSVQQTVKRTA